jgi:hypothetical protein
MLTEEKDERESWNWQDLNALITGVAPLRNNFDETAHFHAPSLEGQVNEIMKEMPIHLDPFVEGTPIGAYTARPLFQSEQLPEVARAMRHQRTVRRVNGDIEELRSRRLGFAQHMPYLVLDREQVAIIKKWEGV